MPTNTSDPSTPAASSSGQEENPSELNEQDLKNKDPEQDQLDSKPEQKPEEKKKKGPDDGFSPELDADNDLMKAMNKMLEGLKAFADKFINNPLLEKGKGFQKQDSEDVKLDASTKDHETVDDAAPDNAETEETGNNPAGPSEGPSTPRPGGG